ASYFIRTVVGTITRSDTSVVGHLIHAVFAVGSRCYRTNLLAGGQFTVHTRNRLMQRFGVVYAAVKIAVVTNPVHLAAATYLAFANHRDVVLSITSHCTYTASRTGMQINSHAPLGFIIGVGTLFILIERIKNT